MDTRHGNWDITVDTVDDFYIQGLAAVTDDQLTVEELIQLAMKTGTMAWRSAETGRGKHNRLR